MNKTNKQTYLEYLDSDAWKLKREQAFEIHGKYCYTCRKTKKLHVHHITYVRFRNEDVENDLIPLCEKCHKKLHRLQKERNLSVEKASQVFFAEYCRARNPKKRVPSLKAQFKTYKQEKRKPHVNQEFHIEKWKQILFERELNREKTPEELRLIVAERVRLRREERQRKSAVKIKKRVEQGVYFKRGKKNKKRMSIRQMKRLGIKLPSP